MIVWLVSAYLGVALLLAVVHGLLGFEKDDGPPLEVVMVWPAAVVIGALVAPFLAAAWLGRRLRESLR